MKTTFRSTTLQAIMRTALLFTVLLSFPATIMAYEETLSSGSNKFKYSLSGDLKDEGKLSPAGINRSNMVFNQNFNLPIFVKAELVSGKNKEYKIEVKTQFSSNGNIKDGPSFIVNNGKLERSIIIPTGTEVVLVDIDYLSVTVYGNLKEYTVFHVQAKYIESGTIIGNTGTQTPYSTEEGKFFQTDDIKNHYSNSNGTTATQTDNTIYDVAPTQPQFPGGAQAMSDYIAKNLKYPADAKQQGKDGFVVIQFVVEKDGSRSDVKVMRNGKLPSMDNEALRVVNSMPKFSPGRNENNQPVRVKFTVPVQFKLN